MNIVFHDNNCCYRGTTVSTYNYADWHERLGNGSSFFCYQKNGPANTPQMIEQFNKRFGDRIFAYDHWSQVDPWLSKIGANRLYMQKGGDWDGKISMVVPTWVHAVFPNNVQPHGSQFAFISEWLSIEVENKLGQKFPWVPYIISIEYDTQDLSVEDLREELGISREAVVFGNLSGEPFGIREVAWARDVILDYADEHPDVYFIFRTPEAFGSPRRNVIFLPIDTRIPNKRRFINTCDAMIHARWNGESFGAAIAEFAACNKPVIHWDGGQDRNHTLMLKDHPSYSGKASLRQWIDFFARNKSKPSDHWNACVADYTPEAVMEKFYKVFT